jgi:hypothetical protein
LVNPPKKSTKVKRVAKRTTTKRTTRKPVRRGATKASRSAGAKKGAATRKRNAAKRSLAGKKAAATRKRNAAKRSTAAKKSAASRKRKTSRKSTRKTSKRGPSKAKRSAAAKKGWRTRKAAKAKRSNAAKRAARTRKSPKRRTTKRKAAPKRKGRMTKAKRSAAAKKGWRTRRSGGYKAKRKKTTRRRTTTRKTSMALATKKKVGFDDFLGFIPGSSGGVKLKGVTKGLMSIPDKFINEAPNSLKSLTYATFTGFTLMGVLGATKSEFLDRVVIPGMIVDGASGVHQDLGSAVDAAIDLATVSGMGIVLAEGLKMDKNFVKTGVNVASLLIAADFVRSITFAGVGGKMTDLSEDFRNVIPSMSNITGMLPGMGGLGSIGGLGNNGTSQHMFGTHNTAMSVGSNNLALAMSPNNTAASGNSKFFGTKSLGSTRVNLF